MRNHEKIAKIAKKYPKMVIAKIITKIYAHVGVSTLGSPCSGKGSIIRKEAVKFCVRVLASLWLMMIIVCGLLLLLLPYLFGDVGDHDEGRRRATPRRR
jgi:hypothetical protein